MYCTKNYYWDSKTEQAEPPLGEDCDYELGFGGLLLPILRFLESSGGANKVPQDVLQTRWETRDRTRRSAQMCGEKGHVAKVCVEGMTRQARTKCCNVAMRHAKGDAIEATHDEGTMRQR
jgi:hypothetical protein